MISIHNKKILRELDRLLKEGSSDAPVSSQKDYPDIKQTSTARGAVLDNDKEIYHILKNGK